ncbi:MAG: hypothetical protein AMXMBFR84_26130 [Candidatus Hydrogenedentota bacterium]
MDTHLGIPSSPVMAMNAGQLEALQASERDKNAPKPPDIDALASHIRTVFRAAEQFKSREITPRLLECKRRYKGEYAPDKLAEIRAAGGNDTYFNITKTKVTSAVSWMGDALMPEDKVAFSVKPTPVPELSPTDQKAVADIVMYRVQTEYPPNVLMTPSLIEQMTDEVLEEYEAALMERAKERCDKMQRKLADYLEEGDFRRALDVCSQNVAKFPTGFLKGPVTHNVRRLGWEGDKPTPQTRPTKRFYAPNPLDMFPAPNARNIQDGPLCEVVTYSPTDLMAMRGLPGWDSDAIDKVLAQNSTSQNSFTDLFITGEYERAVMEGRDMTVNAGVAPQNIKAIEYWGEVKAELLKKWNMKTDAANHDYLDVCCVLIGPHVCYAQLNPDPLGNRPYYAVSYELNPDSVWSDSSIPESMADCQDAACACNRNLLDNLAYASGAIGYINVDALAEGDTPDIVPFKLFQVNGTKLQGMPSSTKPVEFFQVSANADVLMSVSEHFSGMADDRTLIPRYIHGNAEVKGAGETASGMSMLMGAAAKGIRRVISYIDQYAVREVIYRLWVWEMIFGDDLSLKGDAYIAPTGVLAKIARDQMQIRRQEFLRDTNNDYDRAIMGEEGRAVVLRLVAEGMDLPADEIVPSNEVIRERAEQRAWLMGAQRELEMAA